MSKHSEHTPGPWKIAATFAREIISGSCIVATPRRAHSPGSQFCPTDDSTVEANARLIAAAPEMLALIRALLVVVDDCAKTNQPIDDDYDYWNRGGHGYVVSSQARTLLARIEGKG